MAAKVHLITGGQRSGKSAYAEQLGIENDEAPIYLATSKKWDDEHAKRIEKHINSRSNSWITIEEEIDLPKHDFSSKTVLLDCITLWLTNIYDEQKYGTEKTLKKAKALWDELLTQDVTLIVVSNEIGMGVIPMEAATRKFVDLQGLMNQYIAKKAEKVTLMVSGLPLKVK